MDRKTAFPGMKTGPVKNLFLMGILCCLIIPQLVSGGTSGTAIISANVIESPIALFTANITAGTAPLTVEFTDLSTGGPTSWNWEFGDGTNSTDQNPTHTYASGNYTVDLTVTNAAGNSTRESVNYITALLPSTPSQPTQGNEGVGSNAVSGQGIQQPGPQLAPQNPQAPAGQGIQGGEQRGPPGSGNEAPTINLPSTGGELPGFLAGITGRFANDISYILNLIRMMMHFILGI